MKKAALVTGAGGYIGSEIARRLAREGYAVAVADITAERAQPTVDEIKAAGGDAVALGFDVANPAECDKAVADTVAAFGRIDVMVHAAGGSARLGGPGADFHPLTEQEDRTIDAVLKVNLFGAIYTSRSAAREIIAEGHDGRIIHISSAIGLCGLSGKTEYAVAKGGVIALAKSLAKELGPKGITVNTVAPGTLGNATLADDCPFLLNTNFLKRRGNADDVASCVAFLASDDADFITGHTIPVDGGRSLGMKGSD